jgi:cytochrome c55X
MNSSIIKQINSITIVMFIFFMQINQSYADEGSLSNTRKSQLVHIVKQDCGSCHGMTLKGGLGPALLVEDLQNKPLLFIQNTILYGRAGTAMPPWKNLLTEQEVLWISQQLKAGKIVIQQPKIK